jgi:hypothetical protein
MKFLENELALHLNIQNSNSNIENEYLNEELNEEL